MTAAGTDGQLEAGPSPSPDSRRTPAPGRREVLAWIVFALLPISVLVALFVLHLMAASAAAATGGCGGG